MVSAPQHGQHLQNSQNAGANVEDVFQGLSFQLLGCDLARDLRPVASPAAPPSLFGYVSVFWRELMALDAVGDIGKFVPNRKPNASQNVRHAHASIGALSNSFGLDAGFFHDVQKTSPDALHINKDGIAPVALLLFLRRPPAVVGAIAQIVVNSIKGMQWTWFRTHVAGESFERRPLGANADTAPAIRIPLPEIGVVAPIPHRRPSAVKRVGYFEWQRLVSYMTCRQCSTALCHEQGGYENS